MTREKYVDLCYKFILLRTYDINSKISSDSLRVHTEIVFSLLSTWNQKYLIYLPQGDAEDAR